MYRKLITRSFTLISLSVCIIAACKKPVNFRKKIIGDYSFVVIHTRDTLTDTTLYEGSVHFSKGGYDPTDQSDNVDINFTTTKTVNVSYDKSGRLYFDNEQAFNSAWNGEEMTFSGNYNSSANSVSFTYSAESYFGGLYGTGDTYEVTGKKN